jgi:hexosaminidase
MEIVIIPQPVSVQYREGVFQSDGIPSIKGDFQKEIDVVTAQIHGDLKNFSTAEKPVICQKIDNLNISNDEGYQLVISKEKITISAASDRGAYHGLQVFRQLVLSEYRQGEVFTLPCTEITDYPRFSWRGFMLDCSRYFYSIPFIKRLLDVLSLHHISRFHWHLTDDQGWRLPVEGYPLLTEIGSRRLDRRFIRTYYAEGYYSEEQIREIIEYAASRHIDVIPEVDLPGHASAILASYPGLGCTGGPYRVEDRFGVHKEVLCAGNDQLDNLVVKIFDTLAKLFPFRYVHIGGDEVLFKRWKNCPKCQKKAAELGLSGPEKLQSRITCRLVQLLSERGKTAIGWDEVLDDSEQFKLPKETVVMSWRGSEGGIRASGLGHPVIMAPNTGGCYLDYKHLDEPEEPGQTFDIATVFKSYSTDPISPEMDARAASLVLGGQCNLWSELIYAGKIAEYMIFPRLCAIAEALWTPLENKNFDNFSQRLPIHQQRLDRLGILQYRGPLK